MNNGTVQSYFTEIFTSDIAVAFEVFLVLVAMGIMPIIIYVVNQLRKPKIIITPIIKSQKETNEERDFRRDQFILEVTNKGKHKAQNCIVSLKITSPDNSSLDEESDFELLDNIFPFNWSVGTESREKNTIFSKNSNCV